MYIVACINKSIGKGIVSLIEVLTDLHLSHVYSFSFTFLSMESGWYDNQKSDSHSTYMSVVC